MSSSTRPKPSRKASGQQHRSTLSLQRAEVTIHVYDLLPPGKVSTVLWAIGSSLLHTGVVIGDKEYAYGGHDRRDLTGVYWTKPGQEPPGGTFRQAILHGFSFRPAEELESIIQEASHEFQGTSYNLLTKNCNHFTSYLCEKLTGRPAPSYLNRAASIGVALPCVVPREWIAPPDYDTADGELLDEDFEDEGASMLRHDRERERHRTHEESRGWEHASNPTGSSRADSGGARGPIRYEAGNLAPRLVSIAETDSSGRTIPPAERAPLPRNLT
ncbi:Peptidase C97 domain containing protein [Pyrenophora tritici-repentis]|uniref:Peptidase-C97 domain containing protein n=1 Tax=Pyrenophora tritici-repentis TaxID=45151 RepID=A0A2W1FF11_9PLEO|nr:Peptidase C97 domain containing protein [Pyrenophora tritici-repentis]KAI0577093.1 Peptidase-C97 domain-containing protein [Pyrenophora tritici-repentis]KAI0589471.1 Peptidase-C97 domain-containing protein [Pyrenophora tritici-repentis]KAI0614107.1 Peptidase-C97 domain-containing protein [Pyrenophora tritici-repentis]KAI0626223.1 Peptidase-C97 domain-containing protein [Pyrenophora tritici-repentis]